MKTLNEEWIPLRQAVVEVSQAYSQFMLCPPKECLSTALERIFSRLEREICGSRAYIWEYCVEKDADTLEQHYGERSDPDSLIPGKFWENVRLFANERVSDWVAGEYSYTFEGEEGVWGAGLAIDVEVTRYGLPLVGGEYGKDEPAISRRVVSYEPRGRPRKWDWEGAMVAIVAQANTPDGLPVGHGAQAAISRMMAEWFRNNQGGEPAPSEIGIRSTKILRAIEANR